MTEKKLHLAICKYIKSFNIGWILEEENFESLLSFISSLTNEQYRQIRLNYNLLPSNHFAGDDQIKALLNRIKINEQVKNIVNFIYINSFSENIANRVYDEIYSKIY